LVVTALSGGALVACFTAPPPDLPAASTERPSILVSSVVPSPAAILTALPLSGPLEFEVPVHVSPGQYFQYEVFVDYQGAPANAYQVEHPNPVIVAKTSLSPGPLDGGDVVVPFTLDAANFSPGQCPHVIQFFVAYQFDTDSLPTPETFGGDSVQWFYEPPDCETFDAGDGAFPAADAPVDALPVAPESGAGGEF
jgi:hypothetical protein